MTNVSFFFQLIVATGLRRKINSNTSGFSFMANAGDPMMTPDTRCTAKLRPATKDLVAVGPTMFTRSVNKASKFQRPR